MQSLQTFLQKSQSNDKSSWVLHGRFTVSAEVVYELCEQDALCIVEQDIFDQIYGLIRRATHTPHQLHGCTAVVAAGSIALTP